MVLLIDDDNGIRGLIITILTRHGISIDIARNKHRAVLLDLMMPKTNGVIVMTALSYHMLRDFKDAQLVWALRRKPFDTRRSVAAAATSRIRRAIPARWGAGTTMPTVRG